MRYPVAPRSHIYLPQIMRWLNRLFAAFWRWKMDSNHRYQFPSTHTFQACSFNHSDISPKNTISHQLLSLSSADSGLDSPQYYMRDPSGVLQRMRDSNSHSPKTGHLSRVLRYQLRQSSKIDVSTIYHILIVFEEAVGFQPTDLLRGLRFSRAMQ